MATVVPAPEASEREAKVGMDPSSRKKNISACLSGCNWLNVERAWKQLADSPREQHRHRIRLKEQNDSLALEGFRSS